MKSNYPSLRLFVWMTCLTGIIYPLLITLFGNLFFQSQSKGSLVSINNQVKGSSLIGQKFESERYFWSRPSAVDYNPLPSGGSNLGPTSRKLKELVEKRRKELAEQNQIDPYSIPQDLLFASGSGLDPHISPEAARIQIKRIAKARSQDPEKIGKIVNELIEYPTIRLFGAPRVNVLLLNLKLDLEKE